MQPKLDTDLAYEIRQISNQLATLQQMLADVVITPKPEWLPIHAYAAYVGRSSRTVIRMIRDGRLEMKLISGVKMVKVQ